MAPDQGYAVNATCLLLPRSLLEQGYILLHLPRG
jgi:hypothetical protein